MKTTSLAERLGAIFRITLTRKTLHRSEPAHNPLSAHRSEPYRKRLAGRSPSMDELRSKSSLVQMRLDMRPVHAAIAKNQFSKGDDRLAS